MDFEKLAKEAYENAKLHGWHDEEKPDRHWLFMIITELAEVVEADRCNRHAQIDKFQEISPDRLKYNPSARKNISKTWCQNFEMLVKNSVEDELADVCIRLFDLAGLRGVSFKLLMSGDYKYNLNFAENTETTNFLFGLSCILTSIERSTLEEIIDTALYCVIQFCKYNYIDLEWFIEAKMRYNKSRSFRHGGKNY